MAKFAPILLLVGVFITVQALPTHDELLEAARKSQLEQLQKLLHDNFAKNADFKNQPVIFDGVRNLKPVDGGHVYGEAEYSFHSASNIDGKTKEDHSGHKIINTDGKVKEFDFTPKGSPGLLPALPGFKPPQIGNEHSASDYSVQYGPSSAGKPGDFQPVLPPKVLQDQFFINSPNQEKLGGQNAFNHQYSYSQTHSYVDGKPVDGPFKKPIVSPLSYTDIKDLKPTNGGQVFGQAEFQYHTTTKVDGKVSEDRGGHKVINNNGQIQEFDLTPVAQKSPVGSYSRY